MRDRLEGSGGVKTARRLASGGEATAVRHRDAEVLVRIDRGIVDANFVMEVWTRGATTGADKSDDIAAVNALTRGDGESGKMPIASADSVAVIDHDRLAVAAHDVGEGEDAVGGSHDRSAIAAADIYAAVECAFPVERVNALAKACGDLAFDGPEIGSRIRLCPVGRGGVAGQAHSQTNHCGAGQSGSPQSVKLIE